MDSNSFVVDLSLVIISILFSCFFLSSGRGFSLSLPLSIFISIYTFAYTSSCDPYRFPGCTCPPGFQGTHCEYETPTTSQSVVRTVTHPAAIAGGVIGGVVLVVGLLYYRRRRYLAKRPRPVFGPHLHAHEGGHRISEII